MIINPNDMKLCDEKVLKMMIAECETMITAIIPEWVVEHIKEMDE